jgi:hypothetical protein
MPPIGAVAAVSPVERGHPVDMRIDRVRHPSLEDAGKDHSAERATALAALLALCLHALHQLECPPDRHRLWHWGCLKRPPKTPDRAYPMVKNQEYACAYAYDYDWEHRSG